MDIGASLAHFYDPVALLFVVAGAFVIAVSRCDRDAGGAAFAALRPLFTANPRADSVAAMRAVSAIERVAEARSIVCADRVATAQRFLQRAAHRLSDAVSATAFARWAGEEIEDRRRRHQMVIDYWMSVGEIAPGLGMIGTIVGLAGMFASMQDADAIGPAMAIAILTTLYGVTLANLVALPVARRLERLSEDELAWQRRALDHLEALARAELEGRSPMRLRAAS